MTKNKEKIGVSGTHIFTLCDMTSKRAQVLSESIEWLGRFRDRMIRQGKASPEFLIGHWNKYNELLHELHENFMVKQWQVENLTTTVGRGALMTRLSGTTSNTGIVNYGALGTGNTAPNVADTTLQTETYRKSLSSGAAVANVAYLENFYTASEVTGTFREYGFFIDGSGTPDSGILWNRFLSTVTKSSSQSLNVQSIITLASA